MKTISTVLLSVLLAALLISVAACHRGTGDTYPQRLLPAGRDLEIPVGGHERFFPGEGRCIAFSHQGISFRGQGKVELRLSITLQGESSPRSTLEIPVPSSGGDTLKFRRPPILGEFSEIELEVRGKGKGSVSIHSPQLLRSIPLDQISVPTSNKAVRKPDIFFIMIDTLRRDHVGCYGSTKNTTPEIDAFSREAIVFEDAIAQSPWTRPSVASMFTGVAPYRHGVNGRDDALSPEADLLPEDLKAAGYQTAGVITNGNVCAKFGFDQGFDDFQRAGGPAKTDGSHALKIAKELIASRDPKRPFFMYFHLSDPHAPYRAPAKFLEKFAPGIDPAIASRDALRDLRSGVGLTDEIRDHVISLYDGEVAFTDSLVGDFLSFLKAQKLYDSSVILLVADHGEEFWEHGIWGHGGSLHSAVLRVPMILRIPGQQAGIRSTRMVQHIDILPTILKLAGIPRPRGLNGIDLLKPKIPGDRRIFSYIDKAGLGGISLSTRNWKFIQARSGLFVSTHGAKRLYSRNVDPAEERDLSGEYPEISKIFEEIVSRELSTGAQETSEKVQLRGQLRKDLEALGYIEAGEKLGESAN